MINNQPFNIQIHSQSLITVTRKQKVLLAIRIKSLVGQFVLEKVSPCCFETLDGFDLIDSFQEYKLICQKGKKETITNISPNLFKTRWINSEQTLNIWTESLANPLDQVILQALLTESLENIIVKNDYSVKDDYLAWKTQQCILLLNKSTTIN